MKQHPNFYENMQEACRRLRGTVVTYDGTPYVLVAIANHKPDNIFRVYLSPLCGNAFGDIPPYLVGSMDHGADGPALDTWMKDNPDKKILRKTINSPAFNRFRPFPLGMCNWNTGHGAQAFYCMRQPTRNKEQGLTSRMVLSVPIKLNINSLKTSRRGGGGGMSKIALSSGVPEPDIMHPAFASCVLGNHPSLEEVLSNLRDPSCENESAAFHREFAISRGPVGTLFLVYKSNAVGFLPNGDTSRLVVSSEYEHTLEAIHELEAFENISVNNCW